MSRVLDETLEQFKNHFKTAARVINELQYSRNKCKTLQQENEICNNKIKTLQLALHELQHEAAKTVPDDKTVILRNVDKDLLNKQRMALSDVLCRDLSQEEYHMITGLMNMLDAWYDKEHPPEEDTGMLVKCAGCQNEFYESQLCYLFHTDTGEMKGFCNTCFDNMFHIK